jgi:pimeloyl-ACP methyl ester carboxylesterase
MTALGAPAATALPPLFRPRQLLRVPPPLQREPTAVLEWRALRRDPIWHHQGVPEAPPRSIALIPGFLAGDVSLGPLTDWLRGLGHRTARVGIRMNVGCSTALIDRLEERVERHADRYGRPVMLIGQSRGGQLARGLAMRRPDLVDKVVSLGSPHTEPFAVHPLVLAQVGVVGALGTLGVPGLFDQGCFRGECCDEFRRQAFEPLPEGVEHVAVYSRTDGVVDWRSCLAAGAEHVEVPGTHFGMAINRHVYRVLARTLATPVARPAPLVAAA